MPCLKALKPEIDSVGGELIVFDNNSRDNTVASVKTLFQEVSIIVSGKNIGFAAANNSASKNARGEFLLFANPDIIIDTGAVRVLMDALIGRPDAGAVTARMRNKDGSFQATCRNFPSLKNIFFSRGSFISELPVSKSKSGSIIYTLGDFENIAEVPASSATCLMMRKDFFDEIGGFDERFFLFMEDTDLCGRINQKGKKVYFVPGAGAVHYWGRGSAVSPFKRSLRQHISVWKYFLKYFPNGFSVFIMPILLIFNLIITMLSGFKKQAVGQ